MSDESQEQQQVEEQAPVAPPPAEYISTGQPTAEQVATEPKKKRTGLIIAVVVGLVVLCGLGGCAALMMGGLSAAGEQAELVSTAETHYAAAQTAVETATTAIEQASGTDDADAAIEQASDALRTGRDEIAAARVAIEQLDESQGRTDYLASLDAATTALDGLEDLLAYLSTANDMTARMEEAANAASKAHDNLNDAISSGNAEKYSAMKKQATTARDGFEKAAEMFRAAHDLDTSAGLDKAADYAEKRQAQAVLVIRMADEGKADKTSAYNKSIDKMEKLGDEADKIGEPDIVSDPNWVENRLASLTEAVMAAAAKADELHTKAMEELG